MFLPQCATVTYDSDIEQKVAEAVALFEKTFKLKVDVPIFIVDEFSDKTGLKDETIGVCYYAWQYVPIRVELQRQYMSLNPEGIEQLVFHELGHCVMKLHHNDKYPNIMEPSVGEHGFYFANREKLWKNLFFQCKYVSGVCKDL